MDFSPGQAAERLLQFQFLLALYTFTGNSPKTRVPYADLHHRGVDERLFINVIKNLRPEGLILCSGNSFQITQKGVDAVRHALARPFEATEYFPPIAPLFTEKLTWPVFGGKDG